MRMLPFDGGAEVEITALYSLFTNFYEKSFQFCGEMHDFWEFFYVVHGEVQVSGDERVYALSDGDAVFHKPLELHKFIVTGDKGAQLLIFSFNLEGNLKNHFRNKVYSLTEHQKHIVNDMIAYVENQTAQCKEAASENYYKKYFVPAKHSKIYLQRVVYYIYQLFLDLADDGSVTESISTPETGLFGEAVKYMLKNVHQNLNVEDIARACGVSVAGLKRLFAKYGGMGVHKYFLNLKLNAALNLLQGGHTVAEVTELLNFSSQSYFSAAFKRETGKSPSEFKA